MIQVVVVGEGQTEESFVRDVLAPTLGARQLFLWSRLIATSRQARGGALNRDRVLNFLRNTLRERDDTYVTTFFDLYGLAADFPGQQEVRSLADPIMRAEAIERHLAEEVIAVAGCRADRFMAHIQPYEFEALLFSDPTQLVATEPAWAPSLGQLQSARAAALTPEHINDGADTHPSERLHRALRPRYQKVLHGPAAAQRIGLDRIRVECRHFGRWLDRLESLQPL